MTTPKSPTLKNTSLVALAMVFLSLLTSQAFALTLTETDKLYPVHQDVSYWLTDDQTLNVMQAAKQPEKFALHRETSPLNLGYSKQTLWLNFMINNQTNMDQWILEYRYYPPHQLDIYQKNQSGAFIRVNTSDTIWPSRYLAYQLELPPGESVFYVRMATNSSLTMPFALSTAPVFSEQKQVFYFAQALYFGWISSLILYNAFLFFSLRDRRFGIYASFATSLGIGLALYYGFPQQFLGLAHSVSLSVASTVFLNISILLAIAFIRRFIDTRKALPKSDRVLQALSVIFWMSLVVAIFQPESALSSIILSIGAPVWALSVFVIALVSFLKGHKAARFFLIAWSALLAAAAIGAARNFGWIPTNTFTYYILQIGSAIEMLLLAMALADAMRIERAQHEQTQQASLADSQAMQKILTENQSMLEYKVSSRTQNIQASLSKVQSAFKTYMRFGAMISHEFKNPLNAMLNQIDTLKLEKEHGIDHSERRLTAIEGQATRLKTLFEHWLSTDQLISGQLSPNFKSLALSPWLQDARELIESIHPDCSFEFSAVASEDAYVQMDPTLVQVALFNLIDNACRYSAPGEPITIQTMVSDQSLALSVVNEPASPMNHDQLQESLGAYQSFPKSHHEGTGLGLSLVKLIAETHQGTLAAELIDRRHVQYSMSMPVIQKG